MNFIFFILVASFWSGSFVAIQPLVKAMPPIAAGALRIGVAIIFLTILLSIKKIPLIVAKEIRWRVWLTGLFAFGLPFSLLFWGEKSVSPGLAGIINGTVPIWVFILGAIFSPGAEAITGRKVTGLALGILGVLLIFLPKLLTTNANSSLLGALAVAGMAWSYATGVLLNRSLFTKNVALHPFANLYQQLLAGFLAISTLSVFFEGWPHPQSWAPSSTVLWGEIYLGCFSTTLAFMMFYHLIKAWGSVRAATVTYVVPTLALGFDLILNGTRPLLNELFGVCAVTLGVVILNLPKRAGPTESQPLKPAE